jgi:hypothetical protein
MTRYQITVLDGDMTDVVHEIAVQVTARLVQISGEGTETAALYPAIFQAAKESLRPHVRGFHVCGCRPHCIEESAPTELAARGVPAQDLAAVHFRSPRIHRYVLILDIPLREFARDFEIAIMKAAASHSRVRNWKRSLFPAIRNIVEPILGRYLYFTPSCNRPNFICEVGVCTEFDPWDHVAPKNGSHAT